MTTTIGGDKTKNVIGASKKKEDKKTPYYARDCIYLEIKIEYPGMLTKKHHTDIREKITEDLPVANLMHIDSDFAGRFYTGIYIFDDTVAVGQLMCNVESLLHVYKGTMHICLFEGRRYGYLDDDSIARVK